MGSPPGSPYAVSVELMTTTLFSACSTTTSSKLVKQTTSAPNAVGVRRRHTLPGLLTVFYPTEIGDFNPILRSNLDSLTLNHLTTQSLFTPCKLILIKPAIPKCI